MSIYERECPRCAETVKRKAQVCRYCGHEFEDWEAQRRQIEAYEYQQTDEWLLEVNTFLESCGGRYALKGKSYVGKLRKLRKHLLGLTSLWLYKKDLTILPDSIGNLTGLTSLDLGCNNLTSLPESIGNLTGLISLNLYENKLTSLPESIGDLTGLDYLSLQDNPLTHLSPITKQVLAKWITTEGLRWSMDNAIVKEVAPVGSFIEFKSFLVETPAHSIYTYRNIEVGELKESLEGLTSLNLWGRNLTILPESIGNLTGLTELNLWGNNLTILPESIGTLTGLTGLYLGDNNLTTLPESIGNLSHLENLGLSNNNFTELSSILERLSGLKWLSLYGNDVRNLSTDLAMVSECLDLDYRQIKRFCLKDSVPIRSIEWCVPKDTSFEVLQEQIEQCASLNNISRLSFESGDLSKLPESIGNLTGLTSLYLGGNNLTSLPESIGNLTGLTELNLMNSNLTTLPESIGDLTGLTELNLWGSNLTTLPEGIGNLTGLRRLNLWNNNLTTLPESIGDLTGLTELNLTNSNLTTLPESIGDLTGLTELNLVDNPLTDLSPTTKQVLANWITTEGLRWSMDNAIVKEVAPVGSFIEFKLFLVEISAHSIYPYRNIEVGKLKESLEGLTELDLRGGNLTILPESIGKLTGLTKLYLFNNNLTILPESIGNLTGLTSLYLEGNNLTSLPESIVNLTGLTWLDLRGNNLTHLSPKTKQQLFAWYLEDGFCLDVSGELYNELLRLKKRRTIKQLLIAVVVLSVIFWLIFS